MEREQEAAWEHLGISIDRHRGLIGLAAGTFVLMSLIFAPLGLWPLSFVCLVAMG